MLTYRPEPSQHQPGKWFVAVVISVRSSW